MNRVRRELRCAVCRNSPFLSSEGKWVCDCQQFQWWPERGYPGTEEDRELLGRYGWRLVNNAGFAYWIAPGGTGVVSIYTDNTWSGGPAAFATLEEYLDWHARGQPFTPSPKRP